MSAQRTFRIAVLAILVSLISIAPAYGANGSAPPRFSPEAAAAYQNAAPRTLQQGADAVVLEYEQSYTFDANGNFVHTAYEVYKVLTQHGAEQWDDVSASWEPWREERPTLRARVITPDKVVHELDPKTITDSPAKETEDHVFSDRRVLRAPLPAIAPGSIVEQEVTWKETPLLAGSGTVERIYFGQFIPVEHMRLTIEAPTSVPLRYNLQLLPDVTPQKSEADGKVRVVFESGPKDALSPADTHLPSDIPRYPNVTFSTATSWQALAEQYEKIVEKQIAQADVKALVAKLTAGKNTRDEKAAAILYYVHRQIRYTGVEFGEASVVPRTPAEILSRKYGDCKDKAALLVALLRAADIPAYVALLNAGFDEDVSPELPGMGMFDHAIVYVPGPPEIWIDATDDYAKLGQLPSDDQERLSLVAQAGRSALVRTPAIASTENGVVETREIFLAEYGPARVVETSHPRGSLESGYRRSWVDIDSKDAKDNLTSYMQTQYLADKLDRAQRSDPSDLSKPFELVLEAKKSKRGFTDLNEAVVAIRFDGLFNYLPAELQRSEKEQAAAEGDDATPQPSTKRTADWQLRSATLTEWRYMIVPPPGFKAKTLPQNKKLMVGPAILTQDFSALPDGVVHATIRFDVAQRRITASQAAEMRNQIVQLNKGEPILIYFEPIGQALLAEGKVREAFQSYKDVIAANPKKAVPHLRMAQALIAAGMGEAARQEAKTAVALEPNLAMGQAALAGILEYDVVGRKLRPGSDYAGAEAAFRTAIKLDPADNETAANLAILLEYDDEGTRYGPGAKLKDAIVQYRVLGPEKLAGMGLANNLAYALFYDRQFAEARKAAESLNPQPNSLMVACEAALSGSSAAIAEAHRRASEDQRYKEILKTAGEMLLSLRMYPLAADLMEAGASGANASQTAAMATMLKTLLPREQVQLKDDPAGLMLRFFLLLDDRDISVAKFKALSSRNACVIIDQENPEKVTEDLKSARQLRALAARLGLPSSVFFDIMVGLIKPAVTGNDETGYRVTATVPGSKSLTMFIVKENGSYKLLDAGDRPAAIGLEVLDRIKANQLESAKVLLDWVREEQHLAGGDDPLAGPVFPRFWNRGDAADAEKMKLAAAAILVGGEKSQEFGIPILEAAEKTATSDTAKVNIALALSVGYGGSRQYEKQLKQVTYLAQQYPASTYAFSAQVYDNIRLGQFDAAEKLVQARLQRMPDDLDALRELPVIAVAQENYIKAHELDQRVIDTGKATAHDYNGIAWHALYTGKVVPSDLEYGLKATQMSQNNPNILHTLASVYAEMGKTKEAREVLLQAMDIAGMDEPTPPFWYVLGRIAEQYGLRETSAAAYARVPKPKLAVEIPDSTYRLAQMRVQALNAAAGQVAITTKH